MNEHLDSFEREAKRLTGAHVSELEKRLAQSAAAFDRRLKGHLDAHMGEAQALLEQSRSARERIARQTDHLANRMLTSLREQCDRAEYLAGRDSGADAKPATGSLAELVERAQGVLASIEAAETRARELCQSLHTALGELESRLEGPAPADTDRAHDASLIEPKIPQMSSRVHSPLACGAD